MKTAIKTNWFAEEGRIYLQVERSIVGWYRRDFISGQFRCAYTEGHRRDHECSAEADARGWLLEQAGVEV